MFGLDNGKLEPKGYAHGLHGRCRKAGSGSTVGLKVAEDLAEGRLGDDGSMTWHDVGECRAQIRLFEAFHIFVKDIDSFLCTRASNRSHVSARKMNGVGAKAIYACSQTILRSIVCLHGIYKEIENKAHIR